MSIRKFAKVDFRCEQCQQTFTVEKPIKQACSHCGHEYDFTFLTQNPSLRSLTERFGYYNHLRDKIVRERQQKNQVDEPRWKKRNFNIYTKTIIELVALLELPTEIVNELLMTWPKDRHREMVDRRKELTHLLRDIYHLSWHEIGLLLKRDHSTVIHHYTFHSPTKYY